MIFSVKDIMVRNEIADTPFICDLKKCKGACCTFESKFGAPLRQDEIGKIDNILNVVKSYLNERNIEEIETNGFYEKKTKNYLYEALIAKNVFLFVMKMELPNAVSRKRSMMGKQILKNQFPAVFFLSG